MMIFTQIIPDLRTVHLYRPNTNFGKHSLKHRAAIYLGELGLNLVSARYNYKSVLRKYLLNIEH